MVFGMAAHGSCYLKEDRSETMHQGRGGSDVCEHLFSQIRYINSNPNMQQGREGISKASSQLGMHNQSIQDDDKGNSGTAQSETTAKDLLVPVPKKKRKRDNYEIINNT
mmetsp:Transcript_27598/g.58969  ORF Transcript_27598/g.58969 Transcript_27598/m.58969 type:complete len:109 (+) Transcript_27598:541-867(+)